MVTFQEELSGGEVVSFGDDARPGEEIQALNVNCQSVEASCILGIVLRTLHILTHLIHTAT